MMSWVGVNSSLTRPDQSRASPWGHQWRCGAGQGPCRPPGRRGWPIARPPASHSHWEAGGGGRSVLSAGSAGWRPGQPHRRPAPAGGRGGRTSPTWRCCPRTARRRRPGPGSHTVSCSRRPRPGPAGRGHTVSAGCPLPPASRWSSTRLTALGPQLEPWWWRWRRGSGSPSRLACCHSRRPRSGGHSSWEE